MGSSLVAQRVKDLVVLLPWWGWGGFTDGWVDGWNADRRVGGAHKCACTGC